MPPNAVLKGQLPCCELFGLGRKESSAAPVGFWFPVAGDRV